MKIAIVDNLGIPYYGYETFEESGMGGSETSAMHIAKAFVEFYNEVTIFNKIEKSFREYGVHYRPVSELSLDEFYDVVIFSRSLQHIDDINGARKILWCHDTFIQGDEVLESLLLSGKLHEVYVLSDWHKSYIENCNHGVRRHPEIMSRYTWQTRNGIVLPGDIDYTKKDKDLFVYNSSYNKGLNVLLPDVWKLFKKKVPQAKLKVIGGYYTGLFDDQYKNWSAMKNSLEISNVEFTGSIPHSEVYKILEEASFMVYPTGNFPETFGISVVEAIAHGVVPITCNYGALSTTCPDSMSWKMDYQIKPDWYNEEVDYQKQVLKFVDLMFEAYTNDYLNLQKRSKGESYRREYMSWKSIALEWLEHWQGKNSKQTIWNSDRINSKISAVTSNEQKKIHVIIPHWNYDPDKAILSVLQQDYNNFEVSVIDDNSDKNLPVIYADNKIHYLTNATRLGALTNQLEVVSQNILNTDIFVFVDGDDWLVNNSNILTYINEIYNRHNVQMTYGSMHSVVDNIDLIAQDGAESLSHPWIMPYTHLRTFSSKAFCKLFNNEKALKKLINDDGEFYREAGDLALFMGMRNVLDMKKDAYPVKEVLYNYNDAISTNDYKMNGEQQKKNIERILNSWQS